MRFLMACIRNLICSIWYVDYESSITYSLVISYRISHTFCCWQCIFGVCRLYTQLGHWILIRSGSKFRVLIRTYPDRITEMRSDACIQSWSVSGLIHEIMMDCYPQLHYWWIIFFSHFAYKTFILKLILKK